MTPAVSSSLAREWELMRAELRRRATDSAYEIWLAPLRPVELGDDTLFVAAPDQIRSWVSERFGELLDECATAALRRSLRVRILAVGERPPASADDRRGEAGSDWRAHPKYTFEQFVIGRSNHLAFSSALAVAETPGQAFNPLFLHGPPGLGKTHLLHAIGDYVHRHGAGMRVRYTTAERFTADFVAAIRRDGMDAFKERFRAADVLLIDDVQFLERKARTEEEFFHTFTALHESGSQLVLTCDRRPREIAALEERLLDRFGSGLTVELSPPDLPTRLAILRKRAHHDGVRLADDGVLRIIAERVTTSARALEAALIRVVAFHSHTRRPMDAALAAEVLDELHPASVRERAARPTIERIQELTCAAFDVSREQLLSPARGAQVAWARQVAMYLARHHTEASLPLIGERFGGRNHTTVIHACRRADARLAGDPAARALVHSLEQRLSEPAHDRST